MARRYQQLELDRQLCFALYAASRAVVRAYGPLLEDVDLTYPQYVTMLALWEAPNEPMTVGELGSRLHLDTGTLTPLLKRLEALGYVRRSRDVADERRVLVEVTSQGMSVRDKVASVPSDLFKVIDMEVDEVRDLRDRLTKLVADLERQRVSAQA